MNKSDLQALGHLAMNLEQVRDEAATKLTLAARKRKDAEQQEREAQREYDSACLAYSRANPPTGLVEGEALKRTVTRRGGYHGVGMFDRRQPDKQATERGTLALCERVGLYRNHYPKVGEWFVVSKSGQTAYKLEGGWVKDE